LLQIGRPKSPCRVTKVTRRPPKCTFESPVSAWRIVHAAPCHYGSREDHRRHRAKSNDVPLKRLHFGEKPWRRARGKALLGNPATLKPEVSGETYTLRDGYKCQLTTQEANKNTSFLAGAELFRVCVRAWIYQFSPAGTPDPSDLSKLGFKQKGNVFDRGSLRCASVGMTIFVGTRIPYENMNCHPDRSEAKWSGPAVLSTSHRMYMEATPSPLSSRAADLPVAS
jgi:hypothetical protein